MLEFVKQNAIKQGFIPLYGDTDSIFISIPGKTEQDVIDKAIEFKNYMNNHWSEFIMQFTTNKDTIQNCALKLDLEKMYSKLLLTDVKKRYFGKINYYKGNLLEHTKIAVTGFETRRDDTPSFFKIKLEKIYELILEHDITKIQKFVEEIEKDIYNCKPEDLMISIKLSKSLSEYTNLPIHVRALKNSKQTVQRGEKINMLYVKDKCEVTHYVEGQQYKIDYEKYIEKFIYNKIKSINYDIYIYICKKQNTLANWV